MFGRNVIRFYMLMCFNIVLKNVSDGWVIFLRRRFVFKDFVDIIVYE